MFNIIINDHQNMFSFSRDISLDFNNKKRYFIKLMNIVLEIAIIFCKIPTLKIC